jgi:hypothetical protein
MKTIKYIIIIAVCALFTGKLSAQDLETYKLQLPELILEKGGPIHVLPLTDLTQKKLNNSLSEDFRNEVNQGLQAEGLVFDNDLPSFNPWMKTNLYSITENKDEATYIISGDYNFTTNHVKSYEEKSGAEAADSLPFVYYEFIATSTASVVGNVVITDVETGKELVKIPFSKTITDEDKKIMEHASVKSPDVYIPKLTDYFVQAFRYHFSAVKATYKYDFPKVKPEERDLRKAFRQYKRDLKDLADAGKLKEMYTMYLEIQQKEDSPEVNECIGMCYEILGNYSKAKAFYDKCDNSESKNRIVEQINVQNQLRNLGMTIDEPEF